MTGLLLASIEGLRSSAFDVVINAPMNWKFISTRLLREWFPSAELKPAFSEKVLVLNSAIYHQVPLAGSKFFPQFVAHIHREFMRIADRGNNLHGRRIGGVRRQGGNNDVSGSQVWRHALIGE